MRGERRTRGAERGTAFRLDGGMAVAPVGYLFVATRHVYGPSLVVTALKTLGLLLAYGIILVTGVVLLALDTVLFGEGRLCLLSLLVPSTHHAV